MIRSLKKGALFGAGLLLLAGPALAATPAHDNIVLKNWNNEVITDLAGTTDNAFSFKNSCFGTAGCHGDAAAPADSKMKFTYNDIEKHSYHTQLAANDQYGFNPMNPDGNAWESGPSPKGKNWVQGQGHMGAW
ncbi:MAG: cytochrome C [Deltaproteobacteria bacterium HGW-Deltaproteobacteria-4]|nr:MAG: cytochrome C [Deltaproteobacteria bacterium HGW-Deltaproteobacteria-4]